MLRYKLRTLLILLAILPPLLWFGWTKYEAWKAEQERQRREWSRNGQRIYLNSGDLDARDLVAPLVNDTRALGNSAESP